MPRGGDDGYTVACRSAPPQPERPVRWIQEPSSDVLTPARAHAIRFDRAVVQATWTLPSHASMLTGLDALRHGLNHPFASAPPDLRTVAELCRANGYATGAVTGGGWLHPAYGLDQGFHG